MVKEIFRLNECMSFFKGLFTIKIRIKITDLRDTQKLFSKKSGLEIGGPSKLFNNKGLIPLYMFIKKLDGCNFSTNTIWEGKIASGKKYKYYNYKKGIQYISEASNLHLIQNSKYDFVLSCNCLEHMANPLKAVKEWMRVIKTGGLLLLVLPNKDYCFDHNRSITEFSHLLIDYHNKAEENDLTHLNDILQLHDLEMDKMAGTFEQFKARSLKNYDNRALHQHVFNIALLIEILNYLRLEVIQTYEGQHFVIIGKKKED